MKPDGSVGPAVLSRGLSASRECEVGRVPPPCHRPGSADYAGVGGRGGDGRKRNVDTDLPPPCQPFQADGWCDTINNRAYCHYDGGDCCSSTLSSKKVSGGSGPGAGRGGAGRSAGNEGAPRAHSPPWPVRPAFIQFIQRSRRGKCDEQTREVLK